MLLKYIELIAFDLDGTLLNDDMIITDYTKRGLQKIINNNIICVIISSRSLADIKKIISGIDVNYLSCSNGSLIYNNSKDIIEDCSFLENGLSNEIIKILNDSDSIINLYCKESIYANRLPDYKNNKKYQESLNPLNFNDYKNEEILMIEVIDENNKFVKMLKEKRLKKYNDLIELTDSGYGYYQITKKNIDKAGSMRFICRKLKILPEKTAAVGDSETDIKMLKFTKYGILMKNNNSPENRGDFLITDYDNNNNGAIKYILKNLELKNK